MTVKASKIPSVVNMSQANIGAKRDLRRLICDRIPELMRCMDALGDDPILCKVNPNLDGRIQHVDLTHYYEMVGEANHHLTQAYNLLGQMHNMQTEHGEGIGIEMDAPNGDGGR